MNVRQQTIGFEGWKNEAYPDPLTKGDPWTIGVGATGLGIRKGTVWTDEQIGTRLDTDINACTKKLEAVFPWFPRLNEPRRAVLVGMCFQMGLNGLLGFVRMLDRVRDERWADAANEMRTSLWAKQTPKRANRLAIQLETGEWN